MSTLVHKQRGIAGARMQLREAARDDDVAGVAPGTGADAIARVGSLVVVGGVALDAGVHMRIRYGFYALGGVGIAHRSTDLVIHDRFEGMKTTPRLLLALGWGF